MRGEGRAGGGGDNDGWIAVQAAAAGAAAPSTGGLLTEGDDIPGFLWGRMMANDICDFRVLYSYLLRALLLFFVHNSRCFCMVDLFYSLHNTLVNKVCISV